MTLCTIPFTAVAPPTPTVSPTQTETASQSSMSIWEVAGKWSMKYVCVHVCVHACVNMCVHAACGLCLLCLHYGEPCDFSTLFSVSMATHETVCVVRVTRRTNLR